jgi:hypothetical protein
LRWQGHHWELIDRGSLNGTWLNGVKLTAGKAYALKKGEAICFGDESESWTLVDTGAPSTLVVALDTAEIIYGATGVIGVPSNSNPHTTVYLDVDGSWKLEAPDTDIREIVDGEVFESDGRLFRFCCPVSAEATAAAAGSPVQVILHFTVSRDEEFVALRLEHPSGQLDLGSRLHNYLLLLLARAYLADVAAGFPADTCGWLDKQDLATRLKISEQQVDGEVHRIRKHFGQHGLPQAATIIDRRTRTRQLRIGIPDLRIHAG